MKVLDVLSAFSRDAQGRYVLDLIQDSIDSARLSFALYTLDKELKALPEFAAYQKKHDELIEQYGRKTEDGGKVVDGQCGHDAIEAYAKAEQELLEMPIEREVQKIPLSLFDGQKVKGLYLSKISAFIDG